MKFTILFFFLNIFLSCGLMAQTNAKDTALASEIKLMFKQDQFWRKEFIKIRRKEKSDYDEDTIQKKWAAADSINELKAKKIIKKYGYPGYKLVGEGASENFWAIVQHCDDDVAFQERVLLLMKKEINRNNASNRNYAYLTDRVLVNKKKKQIYGTQTIMDESTKKIVPLPLQDPERTDRLRKQMGLEPLAEYLKSIN